MGARQNPAPVSQAQSAADMPQRKWRLRRPRTVAIVGLLLAGTAALLLVPIFSHPSMHAKLTVSRLVQPSLTLEQQPLLQIVSGSVRVMFASGLRGAETRVQVPLPRDRCARVARALGGNCIGRVVLAETPLRVKWRTPQTIEGSIKADRLVVTATFSTSRGHGFDVSIGVRDGLGSSICFPAPAQSPFVLSIGAGGHVWPAPANAFGLSCSESLPLRVQTPGGATGTTAIFLQRMPALELDASAGRMTIRGTAGTLRLSGNEVAIESHDELALRAENRAQIVLAADSTGSSLEVGPAAFSSVRIDGEERVGSMFARDPGTWLSAVGLLWAVVGGVPALLASLSKRKGD
jgi:hypothetical protein